MARMTTTHCGAIFQRIRQQATGLKKLRAQAEAAGESTHSLSPLDDWQHITTLCRGDSEKEENPN